MAIRYKETRNLTSEQAAYIAGLVDGEGTITLQRQHRNERRRLAVLISSTERQLLEYVLVTAGVGKITRKKTYSAKHAQSFTYAVTSRQALGLLRQISVYLLSYKKLRAELALSRYVELTPRNGKYSEALSAQRESFEIEFLELKANGIEEPTAGYVTELVA